MKIETLDTGQKMYLEKEINGNKNVSHMFKFLFHSVVMSKSSSMDNILCVFQLE